MPSSSPPLLILIAPLRSSCALIGLERSFSSLQLSPSQQLAANYHLFCSCFSVFRHVGVFGAFGGAVVLCRLSPLFVAPARLGSLSFVVRVVRLRCGVGSVSLLRCLLCLLSIGGLVSCASGVSVFWFCCGGCPPWRCPGACSGARWRGSPWSWRLVCAVRWRRLSGRFCVRLLSLRVRSAAVCVSRRGAFRR